MELLLVDDLPFRPRLQTKSEKKYGKIVFNVPINIHQIRPLDENNHIGVEKCNKLRQLLLPRGGSNHLNCEPCPKCGVYFLSCTLRPETVTLPYYTLFYARPSPVLKALTAAFGTDVTVRIEFKNLTASPHGPVADMKSSEITIYNERRDWPLFDVIRLQHPDRLNHGTFGGKVTITATVMETAAEVTLQRNMKMLDEENECDVTIITKDMKQVKAQKGVLLDQSLVFGLMYQTEPMPNTIEMPNMSEEGVSALLAFLYYRGVAKPNSKPTVAVELLFAADKYSIPQLRGAMEELISSKPDEWLTVEAAINLFLHTRYLGGNGLKVKAIKALKLHSATWDSSPTFVDIFQNDPFLAMELCRCFAEN